MPDAAIICPGDIAVLTLYTPEIAHWAAAVADAKRDYCLSHGYRFVQETRSLDPHRPPPWSKLLLLAREMRANPAVRWLFWTDADAVIMDRGIRLEDFLDSASDLILTRDRNGVNTGVFFVRNVPRALAVVERAYSLRRFTDHPWWEQAAVAEVLRASDHGLRVRLAEKTLFNAYGHEYRPGQFIVHFAGVKSGRGPRVLRALATSADSLCKGSDVRV